MSSAAETAAGADSPDVVAESPFEEAERTGECVEVVDERDETSLTYANPDGTATMELSAVPQRVEGDDGVWVDVDNTLVLGEDRFVRPTASVVDLALPGGGADQAMVTLGQDGMRVAYTWPGSLPEPVLDGATATYPSVLPDVDLVVTVSDTGFREVLVVRSQAGAEALATHDLEFGVETDGVRLESTEEGAARLVDDREVAPNSKSRVTLVNIFEGGTRRLVESRAKQVGESWNASSLTYTYTDSGQVTSIYDGSSASPDTVLEPTDLQCFGYDGFGQLIRAWTPDPDGFTLPERGGGTGVSLAPCRGEASAGAMGGLAPYWNDYRYDDAGMRARVIAHGADGEKTTSTYDRAGGSGVPAHGVTSVQTTSGEGVSTTESYGFDATGNTVSRPAPSGGGQELVWDIEGRLASTTDTTTGVMTSYVYDADGGLLIRRTATPGGAEGASEESVLYAGETEAVVSTTTGADGGDESVVSGRRSYRLGSLLVAQRDRPADADSRWGSLRFVAGDHHQTMTVALDPEDESDPVKRYLDPFGQPRGGQAGSGWIDDKGFLGKVAEQVSGLTLVGARAYDTGLGMFLSVDPILDTANPQSLNGYAYANNNPVTLSDPSGLIPTCSGTQTECGGTGMSSSHSRNTDGGGGDFAGYSPEARTTTDLGQQAAQAEREAPGSVGAANLKQAYYDYVAATRAQAARKYSITKVVKEVGKIALLDPGQCDSASLGCGVELAGLIPGLKFLKGLKALKYTDEASDAAKYGDDVAETAAKVCSFSGATVVLMADRSKRPIEDVRVGDEVIATDPKTGEQAAKRVEYIFAHDDDLTDLALADGSVLTTTEDHPYWSVDDQRFERADELSRGEKVLGADGRTVEVSGLRLATIHDGLAYNLAVEDIHTYHVGDNEILVHNSCFTSLDALNNPKAIEGLTPSQIDDLARNAGFGVRAGSASAKNPATRYYLPGTNGSQGFRVLPQGVPGQPGVKSGAYLKYFGGPLHGTRVPLGMP